MYRLDVKYAKIDAASSGNNELVAAVAGKRIRVISMWFLVSAAVTTRVESDTDGTALTGQMQFGDQGEGFVLNENQSGHFQTEKGEKLNLELSGAVSVDGSLTYVEV